MSQNTIWNEILKKEANRIDDNCDLGEVQKVEADYIVTVKGIFNKLKYRIPKNLTAGFDGRTLYFGYNKGASKTISEGQNERFSSNNLGDCPQLVEHEVRQCFRAMSNHVVSSSY